jgi:hypothetical protein
VMDRPGVLPREQMPAGVHGQRDGRMAHERLGTALGGSPPTQASGHRPAPRTTNAAQWRG